MSCLDDNKFCALLNFVYDYVLWHKAAYRLAQDVIISSLGEHNDNNRHDKRARSGLRNRTFGRRFTNDVRCTSRRRRKRPVWPRYDAHFHGNSSSTRLIL